MILAITFFMSQGARNWPFFTLTTLPVCAAATSRSVWRAQEGRDLQDVDRLRDGGALVALMHVGQNRQAEFLADIGEDRQRLFQSRCRAPCSAGAVGLVEAGLVDQPDAELSQASFSAPAMSKAWARLSSWQGPAIRVSGAVFEKFVLPTEAVGVDGHAELLGKQLSTMCNSAGRSRAAPALMLCIEMGLRAYMSAHLPRPCTGFHDRQKKRAQVDDDLLQHAELLHLMARDEADALERLFGAIAA